MDKSARILVTGGSGMVGRALVGRLQQQGYVSVLAPTSALLDLRDQTAVNQYLERNPVEYIFHLAGRIGGISANMTYPTEALYENLAIAMHVIHAARMTKVKKLLYLGSSCIYPRDCPQPMNEEDILTGAFEPTNEGYAIAKVAGMKLCEYSNKQYGTNFLNLVPCNLYGDGDHFEPEKSHVVSSLIYKFHKAKHERLQSVEVWGRGTSRRELLYVEDVVDAMSYFMSNCDAKGLGAFVNIELGKDLAVSELAELIRNIVGYEGKIVFDASKPDGMPRKLLDVSRATRLGWKAKVEIPDGVRRTYDWYRNNVAVELVGHAR